MPVELRRPRVLRKVEQPARERVARDRLLVSHDARHQPGDRVHDHQRRQLAAATARSRRPKSLRSPVLRAPARPPPRSARRGSPRARARSTARASPWVNAARRGDVRTTASGAPRRPDRLDRAKQRLRLHHHPRTAAKRHIVHDPVPVGREVAEVVDRHVQHAPLDRRARRSPPPAAPPPSAERW